MDKNGNIRITSEDFVKGIADSPYVGIGAMVNLDIHESKGIVKNAFKLEKETASTVVEFVKYMRLNQESGKVYALDDADQVYVRSTAGSWSTIAGNASGADNGLAVWKDWLFTVDSGSNQTLAAYGPLSSSPTWDTNWETIKTGEVASHSPDLITQSDDLWFATDQWLAQIIENSGQTFDPTNSATYTVTEDVFIGVDGYKIQTLDDDGSDFIMGTTFGSDATRADILVWNPEKTTNAAFADRRIPTGGDGINQATLLNNIYYANIGVNGDIVNTNLSQTETLKEINKLTPVPEVRLNVQPDAVSNHDGGILFGLGKNAGSDDAQPYIWFFKNGVWTSFEPSIGQVTLGAEIGSILSLSDSKYLVSWEDNTGSDDWGVDVLSTTKRYATAYFESQFYPVGKSFHQKTYSKIGFKLAKPLTTSQSVVIKFRDSINDAWTTISTWDFATYGAIQEYETGASMITDLTNVQLRVELNAPGTNATTPELMEVYLI